VPGDVWLIFIECVYHLANRHCSSHQYLENPETLGLSQGAKSRGNAIQHFITHSQLAQTVILGHLWLVIIVSVHWIQISLPSRSGTLSSTSICGGLRSVFFTRQCSTERIKPSRCSVVR